MTTHPLMIALLSLAWFISVSVSTRRITADSDVSSGSGAQEYLVFFEKFNMKKGPMLAVSSSSLLETNTTVPKIVYHSEFIVCAKSQFSNGDLSMLTKGIQQKTNKKKQFLELKPEWWSTKKKIRCQGLTFGMSSAKHMCSGTMDIDQSLADKYTPMSNFDPNTVVKYYMGSTNMDKESIYKSMCNKKCGPQWAGNKYNVLKNNCNTFAGTVTKCILKLSPKLPKLGLSNMGKPKCNKCR
jgi:hypothetical protein